eukprot:3114920-Amphidinium_carterae.1
MRVSPQNTKCASCPITKAFLSCGDVWSTTSWKPNASNLAENAKLLTNALRLRLDVATPSVGPCGPARA